MTAATYDGNAIYSRLNKTPSPYFLAPGPLVWPLIYSSLEGEPKAIVVASQIDPVSRKAGTNRDFLMVCLALAKKAGIPFRVLCFGPELNTSTKPFTVFEGPGMPHRMLSLHEWKNELRQMGVPVGGGAFKAINRASSSGYHNWQRENLGRTRVVDIDLIKLGPDKSPTHVVELKRSSIPIQAWEPFENDAPNFQLLGRFCEMSGLGLELVFNRYNKTTTKDDLTTLKIFDYEEGRFVCRGLTKGEEWFNQTDVRFTPEPTAPPQKKALRPF